jgi:uncharacterized protein
LTTRCNLACGYCYQAGTAVGMDMSKPVLQAALELCRQGPGPIHVQLTGGEPTLVPELVDEAARCARAMGRRCTIGIQTNATLLTSKLVETFATHDIQVGVSLDGPPVVQQRLRGEAAQTFRGLKLLEASGVPFRVTTVVSAENVRHLANLVWILAGFEQARGLGLDLLVRKGGAKDDNSARPATPEALRQGVHGLLDALEAVNRRRQTPLELREWNLLRSCQSRGTTRRCFCHAGEGQSVAVHPDGSLYPCSQTLSDPAYSAGNVSQPDAQKLLALQSLRLASAHCLDCALQGCCPGECPSRLHYNQHDDPTLTCELYRALWRPDGARSRAHTQER